ncbi:Microcystin-dependent protein [Candidatus Electrothrix aarhusensis]|uniref:Microcystin-dependent protein n=1 Tax=Candidatus Electrothrix aarhusensis TaxID=1859131 RepID=A0A3S3QQP8_9BACT|nr:Microcystin-dependent protein [Candidatus Electrothrix aarhusensis]
MSEPFLGEISMFPGKLAPSGWAFCDGQLLKKAQNKALFDLLGTIYGGDGHTTFALPDLRGRIPLQAGSGPGLSSRKLGSKGGTELEALVPGQISLHTHKLRASNAKGTTNNPSGKWLAQPNGGGNLYDNSDPISGQLDDDAIGKTGGGQPHNNMMPFQCVNYIIAITEKKTIYPPRY